MSEPSSTEALVEEIFGQSATILKTGPLITGHADFNGRPVAIIGMLDRAYIGPDTALAAAAAVLEVMRERSGEPILIILDNSGHRLGRWDELVGNNECMAHLSKCIHLARRRGHRVIGLVNELAVSSGFMALGMSTDACYALPLTELRVMAVPAMARITKIPLERLTELCESTPVLGPGAENYLKNGAIRAIWDGKLAEHLEMALTQPAPGTGATRELGETRQGRGEARAIARLVRSGEGEKLG